jgi:hypothetical protein
MLQLHNITRCPELERTIASNGQNLLIVARIDGAYALRVVIRPFTPGTSCQVVGSPPVGGSTRDGGVLTGSALFSALLAASACGSVGIESPGSLDRLVVISDPPRVLVGVPTSTLRFQMIADGVGVAKDI